MTLDWLDRAFVGRLKPAVQVPAKPIVPPSLSTVVAIMPQPSAAEPECALVVDRLLEVVPTEWDGLADSIEAVARDGRRVVAVTGGKHGEGRSTVVAGIEAVLRRRGRCVAIADRVPLLQDPAEAVGARAADVVLVDAGPWFTSGPVRRSSLERAALGCDAVLLVRRADAPPCPGWEKALAMIGLTVIGEALTFALPAAQG